MNDNTRMTQQQAIQALDNMGFDAVTKVCFNMSYQNGCTVRQLYQWCDV